MASEQRILVVEDDREMGATLCELLRKEGYDVDLAQNGADAINDLELHGPPRAVIVDLLMPGIVGQELLEYLRGDARLADVPVAIVSGSPHLAPDGYVVFRKPLDLPVLLDFLRAGDQRARSAAT